MKKQICARSVKMLVGLLFAGVMLLACTSCQTTMLVQFVDRDGNVIGSADANAAGSEDPDSEEAIKAQLQGVWELPGGSEFTFSGDSLSVVMSGSVVNGTYTIDTAQSRIIGTLQASDGEVQMQLHYGYADDGSFMLSNNDNVALNKK